MNKIYETSKYVSKSLCHSISMRINNVFRRCLFTDKFRLSLTMPFNSLLTLLKHLAISQLRIQIHPLDTLPQQPKPLLLGHLHLNLRIDFLLRHHLNPLHELPDGLLQLRFYKDGCCGALPEVLRWLE